MRALSRLTTLYDIKEDRISLAGEDVSGATVTLWLTRCLTDRLVTHLVRWLEKAHSDIPRREALLEFAQQFAVGQLSGQAPVCVSSPEMYLIDSIDLVPASERLGINFKVGQDEIAGLVFDPTQLRQWLSIVYRLYLKADWPATSWPGWIVDVQANPPLMASAVLH